MIDNLKFMWVAAFHLGYFNNKDINELLNLKLIDKFYDVMSSEFLESIVTISCSAKLKLKLTEMSKKITDISKTAQMYEDRCNQLNAFMICEDDMDYPYNWRLLSGMPRIVFGKGRRELINIDKTGGVAIVGSRKCSNYSKVATIMFTQELVKRGISIISGMADGIDRAAHETALVNSGNTIAFLAGGVDNIYPWVNKDIYDQLIVNGLVLSEMPPGTKAQKQYFPSRNRLISALSDTCMIMEAGTYSGTLHTASFAAAQGKNVFVLPNTIYSENTLGGLELIADGARILLKPEDVIDEVAECCLNKLLIKGDLGLDKNSSRVLTSEDKITEELSVKPRTADELVQLTSISYTELSVLLSEMEIRGSIIVERGKFTLTRFN